MSQFLELTLISKQDWETTTTTTIESVPSPYAVTSISVEYITTPDYISYPVTTTSVSIESVPSPYAVTSISVEYITTPDYISYPVTTTSVSIEYITTPDYISYPVTTTSVSTEYITTPDYISYPVTTTSVSIDYIVCSYPIPPRIVVLIDRSLYLRHIRPPKQTQLPSTCHIMSLRRTTSRPLATFHIQLLLRVSASTILYAHTSPFNCCSNNS